MKELLPIEYTSVGVKINANNEVEAFSAVREDPFIK